MEFIPKAVPHGFPQHTETEQTASHCRGARLRGARLMTDRGEVPSDPTEDLIKTGKGTWQKRAGDRRHGPGTCTELQKQKWTLQEEGFDFDSAVKLTLM